MTQVTNLDVLFNTKENKISIVGAVDDGVMARQIFDAELDIKTARRTYEHLGEALSHFKE